MSTSEARPVFLWHSPFAFCTIVLGRFAIRASVERHCPALAGTPMSNSTRTAVIGVLALIICLGCGTRNRDQVPVASNGTAIKISADELYTAYEKDVQKANESYRGKTVLVTGRVNGLDEGVILGKEAGVACMIRSGNEDKIQRIGLNSIVSVKGVCMGPKDAKAKLLFVYVTNGDIVDIEKAK
jgi:hypothetical protein